MTAVHHEPTGTARGPVVPFVGGATWPGPPLRREVWVERTMRACEVPSLVDIAKRPDVTRKLSRLLGL